jgi:hypothetical protein
MKKPEKFTVTSAMPNTIGHMASAKIYIFLGERAQRFFARVVSKGGRSAEEK